LLGSLLKGAEIIELRSDLGGGKTTFVKGLARGSGSKSHVVSPTFTLNRVYEAPNFAIHHYDFYRLNDAGIMADQLAETIEDRRAVVVVEWADIVDDVLPKDRISIEFKPAADEPDERNISISYPAKYSRLIKRLETDWAESRP
jgi:tRNA threonylcarbamoyladenosine biosynthesis protein TsaE